MNVSNIVRGRILRPTKIFREADSSQAPVERVVSISNSNGSDPSLSEAETVFGSGAEPGMRFFTYYGANGRAGKPAAKPKRDPMEWMADWLFRPYSRTGRQPTQPPRETFRVKERGLFPALNAMGEHWRVVFVRMLVRL
jgi:hypothetical protein